MVLGTDAVIQPQSPRAVIACGVLRPELEFLLRDRGEDVRVIYLEQSMHRTPHLMPERVQESVDEASRWAAQIVLGYGLCSNGIMGVAAPGQGLITTKAHDCVALFLGSIAEYNRLSRACPGSYYLTQGWILERKDPLGQLENEYIPRMGRETAEWGAKEELRHYTHFVFIDTGVGDRDALRERARENARFFGKEYMEVRGDLSYLERILFGPYDGRSFYLLEPGDRVQQRWFLRETA
jgi:hypothetical protein